MEKNNLKDGKGLSDKASSRVPGRKFFGDMSNTLITSLLMTDSRESVLEQHGWSGRRVLGYKIPEWQRQEVWTEEQCKSFIESMFMGANIGAFMVNMSFKNEACDMVLVDGQQRLRALEKYVADGFSVRGDDGKEWLWSQLGGAQAHLLRMVFPSIMTAYDDEDLLKEAYDRHNFSGTAHEPEQRAGGKGFRV